MAEYTRIVYVNTRTQEDPDHLPKGVENIRDWSYLKSPLVRWDYAQPEDFELLLPAATLVVLDWSSKNSSEAEKVCQVVRNCRADLPILLIESYPGQTPTRDSFVSADQNVAILLDPSDLAAIANVVASLKFILPPSTLTVHPDQNDTEVAGLIEAVGQNQLEMIIQKHFPDGENAYIMPVDGGWSNAKLCRFCVDTDQNVYFLKFFTTREAYGSELAQHSQAKKWLGHYVVDLVQLQQISAQTEAFPQPEKRELYPVCYHSASVRGCPRKTLKELYREMPASFVEQSLLGVLEILATNQPGVAKMEPPGAAQEAFD